MKNRKQQKGFTLIELVMVIVILGILAATALPKFISVKSDAEIAALNGVAGALNSAFAVNYGVVSANSTKGASILSGQGVAGIVGSILVGGVPSGYTVTGAATNPAACGTVNGGASAGATVALTVSGSWASTSAGNTAAATLICTG